jgi:hypothetical protein
LERVVPNSFFLHVIRHPLDTVSSLLSVKWWPLLPLWTRNNETPSSLSSDHVSHAELAAELWVAEVREAMSAGRDLGVGRYAELHYETFVSTPQEILLPVISMLNLDPDDRPYLRALSDVTTSSVGAWRFRLDEAQREIAWNIAEPLASSLGYTL